MAQNTFQFRARIKNCNYYLTGHQTQKEPTRPLQVFHYNFNLLLLLETLVAEQTMIVELGEFLPRKIKIKLKFSCEHGCGPGDLGHIEHNSSTPPTPA